MAKQTAVAATAPSIPGRPVFLATLQGQRCLFSADVDAKVLAVIPEGTKVSEFATSKNLVIIPRKEASEEARLMYVNMWRAEHTKNKGTEVPAAPVATAKATKASKVVAVAPAKPKFTFAKKAPVAA